MGLAHKPRAHFIVRVLTGAQRNVEKVYTIGKSQFSFCLFMALFNMPFPVRLDRKKY